MNYEEALKILTDKQSLGIKPGLSRVYKLLKVMGNPQNKLKIIHIAGTNGKGTVAYTVANSLIDSGFKVGLFTSPWIDDYREQIQINNEYISKNDFAFYVDKYKANEATEFEFLTALMYKYFCDKGVDYAVVECGMGGREDATNTESRNLSVITSISLDHTDFLGDTVEKIAAEKAGIIKENSTCILYPNPLTENIIEDICAEKNTRLVKVKEQGDINNNNLAVAQAVISALGVNCPVNLYKPLGRTELVNGVLLDGGHNVDAAKALASAIPANAEITAVIGMLADKDVDGYLSIVAPLCKTIVAVTPSNPRALPADKLMELALKYCADVSACNNPKEAVKMVRENGLNLVCGSFYLLREVRQLISDN